MNPPLWPTTCRRVLHGHFAQRPLSTSCRHENHYKTLGVPHGASKAQIKSSFYELSKAHHPDISKDPKSHEVFRAVTEAYTVLSNDRDRRSYDRTLLPQPSHSPNPHTYTPHSPPQKSPRATHAWEYSYRPRGSAQRRYPHPSSNYGHSTRPPENHTGYGKPYSQPIYHDILTGTRRRAEEQEREIDRVRNESTFYRAVQLMGLMALTLGVFSAFGFGHP